MPNRYTCLNPGACDCGRAEGEFCRHWGEPTAAWCRDCRQCPAANNPGIGCKCPCHAQAAAIVDLVVAAAKHPDGNYRMEGSSNWDEKPGRLTVWVDLDSATWDEVYDRIAEDEDVISRA